MLAHSTWQSLENLADTTTDSVAIICLVNYSVCKKGNLAHKIAICILVFASLSTRVFKASPSASQTSLVLSQSILIPVYTPMFILPVREHRGRARGDTHLWKDKRKKDFLCPIHSPLPNVTSQGHYATEKGGSD